MDKADARRRRVEGCLLGTAVGDALGLPCEGLDPRVIQRRFTPLNRFRLVGPWGFVSDDTEQSALVAQSLAHGFAAVGVDDDDEIERAVDIATRVFRRALLGWFWRLPFGVGLATIRAAFKLTLGLKNSGVSSAGNGAAMRSGVIGAIFADPTQRQLRRRVAERFARVTHTDSRAVEAAVFVANVAAADDDDDAIDDVRDADLKDALIRARALADAKADVAAAGAALGVSGFVMHSVPFAWFCICRSGATFDAVVAAIEGGGDADTNAAIVGGWVGARAPEAIPVELVGALVGGPFGPKHLRTLATAIGAGRRPPGYFWPLAMLRNLALYPVVLAHGFRRLLPEAPR